MPPPRREMTPYLSSSCAVRGSAFIRTAEMFPTEMWSIYTLLAVQRSWKLISFTYLTYKCIIKPQTQECRLMVTLVWSSCSVHVSTCCRLCELLDLTRYSWHHVACRGLSVSTVPNGGFTEPGITDKHVIKKNLHFIKVVISNEQQKHVHVQMQQRIYQMFSQRFCIWSTESTD